MILRNWAGSINTETIQQFPDLRAWAACWLEQARIAEKSGNCLVVFEVPVNDFLCNLKAIETQVQSMYIESEDPFQFDAEFIHAMKSGKK